MAGSSTGTLFRATTWGESHGKAVGVVVDGCPAGIPLSEGDIQKMLDRRKPGQSVFSTPRKEADAVEILSGVFEGVTLGTPISMMVRNTSQISKDYADIRDVYRPGHADFGFDQKFGFRDYRGGGRSSGRETIGRVAAGAVAEKMLESLGISFFSFVSQIGPVRCNPACLSPEEAGRNPLCMPDREAYEKAAAFLKKKMEERDSAGSEVTCMISGVPAGVGDPVFDKLDARLAGGVMSIGAVKSVEIGDGKQVADSTGSADNDGFVRKDGKTVPCSNHGGGILGGISDGAPIVIRAAVKPTPSIFRKQQTVNTAGQETDIEIHGRHDPVIGPRAAVVVEAMAALSLADLMLTNCVSRISAVRKFYETSSRS